MTESSYLTLDGETVVVKQGNAEAARFPLHTLEGILCFSYAGASPALMGACAQRNVDLAFFTPRGRFLARSVGETKGNVLLRQQQFRAADDPRVSCRYAKGFLLGKIYNARSALQPLQRWRSLPSRGAWIEMRLTCPGGCSWAVAPLAGSVDRNWGFLALARWLGWLCHLPYKREVRYPTHTPVLVRRQIE